MKRAVLAWAVAMCLTLGPSHIESQMPPAPVTESDPAAAAEYLDGRQA